MEPGKRRSAFLIKACLLIAAGFWVAGAPQSKAADPETEAAVFLGKNMAQSFGAEYGVVTDPLLSGWVQRIAAKLTPLSPRQNLRYHFTILDTAEVNAFTLPGGYVFVTRGLLDYARSQDEVAGVMGHEIGHVAGRHPMKIIEWQLVASLALRYGPFPHGTLATAAEQGGAFLATLHFSRQYESKADLFGIKLAYEAGYDPAGLPQFLEDLGGKQHPSFLDRYLATHPPEVDRIRALDQTPYMRTDAWQIQEKVGEQMMMNCRPAVAAIHFKKALEAHPGDPEIESRLAASTAACGSPPPGQNDALPPPSGPIITVHPATPPTGTPSGKAPSITPEDTSPGGTSPGGTSPGGTSPGGTSPGAAVASRAEATESLEQADQKISRPVKTVRRSLEGLRSIRSLNVNLQDALLAAATTRLGDVRWLALAYQAYAQVNRIDDVFSRLARVDYRVEGDLNAMQVETAAAPAAGARAAAAWDAAARFSDETQAAAQSMAQSSARLEAGAGLISAVLADLDTALLGFHHQVSNLRFATVEAALLAAGSEIDRGRRLAMRSVDSLAIAEDRLLILQLDRMAAAASPQQLALFDCNTSNLLGTDPGWFQQSRTAGDLFGDAVVEGALSVEIGKPVGAVQARYDQLKAFRAKENDGGAPLSWIDAASEQGGSPALLEVMLRQVAQVVQEESACG